MDRLRAIPRRLRISTGVLRGCYHGGIATGSPSKLVRGRPQRTLGMSFPDGTIRYGLAPLMPFLGGMLDLALTAFSGDSFHGAACIDPTSHSPGACPEAQQAAMVNRYTMSGIGSVARSLCEVISLRRRWPNACPVPGGRNAPGDFLWIPAFSICVDVPDGPSVSRYTAQHVSYSARPLCSTRYNTIQVLLNYTLNGGPSCAGIMKNGEFAHVVTFGESLLCTPENLV